MNGELRWAPGGEVTTLFLDIPAFSTNETVVVFSKHVGSFLLFSLDCQLHVSASQIVLHAAHWTPLLRQVITFVFVQPGNSSDRWSPECCLLPLWLARVKTTLKATFHLWRGRLFCSLRNPLKRHSVFIEWVWPTALSKLKLIFPDFFKW